MTADIFFSKVAWALKKISLSKLTIKIVVDKETNYIISYSFVCMCLSVFLCVRVGQRWTFQTPWWAARTVVDSLAWRKGNHHFTSVSEINITFPPPVFCHFWTNINWKRTDMVWFSALKNEYGFEFHAFSYFIGTCHCEFSFIEPTAVGFSIHSHSCSKSCKFFGFFCQQFQKPKYLQFRFALFSFLLWPTLQSYILRCCSSA